MHSLPSEGNARKCSSSVPGVGTRLPGVGTRWPGVSLLPGGAGVGGRFHRMLFCVYFSLNFWIIFMKVVENVFKILLLFYMMLLEGFYVLILVSYGTLIPGGGEGSAHCGRGVTRSALGSFWVLGLVCPFSNLDHLGCFVLEFLIHDLGEEDHTSPAGNKQ